MPQSKTLGSVQQAMERALQPGAFITDQACVSFVQHLDRVATQIEPLLARGEAVGAVALYGDPVAGGKNPTNRPFALG